MTDLDEEEMFDALEDAERAGLVVAQQVKRRTRYTFAHELVRQTLIGELSVPRRLRRHMKTAAALERVYEGREAEHAAALAYHYFQAGSVDEEKTTRYLLLAGRQSLAAGAFDEALGQADKALSVIEEAGARRRADLLSLRPSALRGLGRWREAHDTFAEALDLLEALGEAKDLLSVTCTYAEMAYFSTDEHPRALRIMGRTLDATPDVASADRARLLALHATVDVVQGRLAEGLSMSDGALEMAHGIPDPEVLGLVLSERSSLLANAGHITDALAAAREACALLDGSPKRWARLWAKSRLAFALRSAGRPKEVLEHVRDSEEEARAVGHVGAALSLMTSRVEASMNLEPAVETLRAAAAEVRREFAEFSTWGELQWLFDAWAEYLEGDFRRAVERLDGAAERFGQDMWMDVFWSMQFTCAARFDGDRARAILREHEHRMPVPGKPTPVGARHALGVLIEGLTLLGDTQRAAELYPVCVDSLELGFVSSVGNLMQHSAAQAAVAAGDWEAAERHFEAALRLADEIQSVGAQAAVRLGCALASLEREGPGREEKVRGLLEQALPIFERYGQTDAARSCRELLAGLGASR